MCIGVGHDHGVPRVDIWVVEGVEDGTCEGWIGFEEELDDAAGGEGVKEEAGGDGVGMEGSEVCLGMGGF